VILAWAGLSSAWLLDLEFSVALPLKIAELAFVQLNCGRP
jgi:hypothetical protein